MIKQNTKVNKIEFSEKNFNFFLNKQNIRVASYEFLLQKKIIQRKNNLNLIKKENKLIKH